ncbi:MAG: DUF1592 domain-containing protein, partial [Planctomycetaceae bacterium]
TPENRARLVKLRKEYPRMAHPISFYRYAHLLDGTPDPKDFGFRDAQRAEFSERGGYLRKFAYFKHYVDLPHNDQGTYLKTTWGTCRIVIKPPGQMPPGTYSLRLRAGLAKGAPAFRHFVEVGHPQRRTGQKKGLEGFPISSHQITGTIERPEIVETQLEIGTDTPREFAIQERQPTDIVASRHHYNVAKKSNGYGPPPAIWIDWVELEGPLPPTATSAVLQQIITQHHAKGSLSETGRARTILTDFAGAALRRAEPEARFIDKLLAMFETRRTAGESFDVAIRTPLSVILASPGFLYLNEPGSEKARRALTDRELAVRLAYFLWSAPPDSQLLERAEKNALHKPEILDQQVDRMIADPRSDAFVSGFVHQWLGMERLDFFQFDVKRHREFDESTRAAAREEVYQSFVHLLRDPENGRLDQLLKSDYVIINGLLATYYGIEGVKGDHFRKVALPANSARGGLLGMVAIHAMGSDGVESSPVERGAWILRKLLNDPPPPAPPNVPQLSRLADKPLTTRQRLRAHQEEAQCASCHRKIDPVGFGLENFNAAGKWRTTDQHGKKRWKIDPSGKFHEGAEFANYFELRDRIAERQDDFARGFAEALIAYSLGRPFGFIDEDLAVTMLTSAKSQEYAVSEFIQTLVRSQEFRTK